MKQVLFLPGYACKSWIWEEVQQLLGLDYKVTLVDWPTKLTPKFKTLADFADWVREQIADIESYDLIVGHSMGGLIALHLAAMESVDLQQVILIETFLTSPGPFFQKLLMGEAPVELTGQVEKMLRMEQVHYSEQLRANLTDLDMTELVAQLECPVIAIYGDRGCGESEQVKSELGWREVIESRVIFHPIHNACHFPMLENSEELTRVLTETIKQIGLICE